MLCSDSGCKNIEVNNSSIWNPLRSKVPMEADFESFVLTVSPVLEEGCLWWITVGKWSHEGRENQELLTVDRHVQQGAELLAGGMLSFVDLRIPQRERDKHSCCLGELQTAFTSTWRWQLEAKAVNDHISVES